MNSKTRKEIKSVMEMLSEGVFNEEEDDKKQEKFADEMQDEVLDVIWAYMKKNKINFPDKKKDIVRGKAKELCMMVMEYVY